MKKTVQIVTIPLNKQGWSKDDIVMMGSIMQLQFPLHAMESNIDDWQAQQLLVLSDDKPKKGAVILSNETVCDLLHNGETPQDEDEPVKILASYPQIEGTLPISKETIQAWIDAGTPEEGHIELIEGHYVPSTYDQPDNWVQFDSPRSDVDFCGNLLLSFSKKSDTPYIDSLIADTAFNNMMNEDGTFTYTLPAIKTSIPTDEEIEKKAEQSAIEWLIASFNPELHDEQKEEWAKQDYCCGYEDGYTQALKDLGYE